MRVAALVEHDDYGAGRAMNGAQHIVEIGRLERLDLERQPLMHRILAKKRGKSLAIEKADRIALAAPLGPCRRDQLARLGFLRR